MITKSFEIRDSLTFIPVIATALSSTNIEEAYLIGRAGYRNFEESISIMVTRLADCKSANNPYEWNNGSRTMKVAHQFIEEWFFDMDQGEVIDVEFILGETSKPKQSERLEEKT